jgi:hypothetical protein
MNGNGVDLSEFVQLEQSLQLPARRLESARLLLAENFVEFGSSGRVYTKAAVVDLFAHTATKDQGEPPEMLDFEARLITPDTVLVTYRSITCGAVLGPSARRSSIWQRVEGHWQMLFHQGTPISPTA